MKIYLDLLLIQNIFLMFIFLLIFNRILELKISIVRVLTVSVLTSILSVCVLIFYPRLYDFGGIKFLFSFLIVRYGMKIKFRNEIFIKIIVLWSVVILFGGVGSLCDGNMVYSIIIFLIIGVIILKVDLKKKSKFLLEGATCFLEFKYRNNLYRLKALVDTGNCVKTIYEEEVVFVKDGLIDIKGGDGLKKRKVSYKTVSGVDESDGLKVCNIDISYGHRKIKNNAVIVSTPNISESFDAIVSLSFVEGGCTYGNINFDEGKGKEVFSGFSDYFGIK